MSSTIRPAPAGKLTVVEESTEFKGTLTSSCPVDVRGRVEGEINTPALTVSASGAVHGRAKVGAVRSQGEISGEFEAESIELAGVVKDNTVIRARTLDVKLASSRGKLQIIFGECELAVGDAPTESDHLVEAAALALAAVPAEMVAAAPAEIVAAVPAEIVAAMPAEMAAAVPTEMALAPAPATEAAPEANGIVTAEAPLPALPAAETKAEGEEEELEVDGNGGKRKRKRKNGQEEARTGWSHPPSQPPPAS
jgi:cytoskeletal protein CcmA (bactofilin family)